MTQPAGNDAGTPADPAGNGGPAGTELRNIFGMFATGVTVITATAAAGAHGMTANAFTSVSLRPPLVLVCVLRSGLMHHAILDGKAFGISVLSSRQRPLAQYFADRRRHDSPEFDVVDWRPGTRTGVPIIGGALAWMECRLDTVYDGGDHSIFLGEVLDLGRSADADALLFFGGEYRRLG
ncbi:MAG TPA: flavin reductase family protein [Jatrophihabitans sp.]|nr:flavin reductase family protein [Jatrophihabitans sp.]